MKKKNISVDQINDPVEHLKKSDPILSSVIELVDRPVWQPTADYFRALVEDIINQQLSDKASATITKRFNTLFPKLPYTSKQVLLLTDASIRRVGISWAKVSYIKDLAQNVQTGTLDFKNIHKYSDEEVIKHLLQVKGIGRWTAEMFLMFSLGREDVFSYGDQGLKNAIKHLYKLKKHPTPLLAEKISAKWKPYRSLACRYLWRSLDLEDV